MRAVQTVTGPCGVEELGTTLMHEHLMIGWPGWQAEETRDRAARREYATRCIDRMAELRALGVGTLVDPCPIDLGRDVELMAEVAAASGVRIVCATGLYKEDQGAPAYFKFRMQFGRASSRSPPAADGSRPTRRRCCGRRRGPTAPPARRSRRTPSRARWAWSSSTCSRARACRRRPSSSATAAGRATSITT